MGKGKRAMRQRQKWPQEGEVKVCTMPQRKQAKTPLHTRQYYTFMRERQVLKLDNASMLTITLLTITLLT